MVELARDDEGLSRLYQRGGAYVFLLFFAVIAASACDSTAEPLAVGSTEPVTVLTDHHLTAGALSSVDDGVFLQRVSGQRGAISPGRAKALAEVYLHQFGQYLEASFETQHGADITVDGLEADERVLLVESPYNPPEATPPPTRNRLGDYYLVTFLQSGVPVVSIGVAAQASDVSIVDGELQFPPHYGNEFRPQGIPQGTELPISPEKAAAMAVTRTGLRVTAIPRLRARGQSWFPQYGVWEVAVEGGQNSHYVDFNGSIVHLQAPGSRDNIPVDLLPPRGGTDIQRVSGWPVFPLPQGVTR